MYECVSRKGEMLVFSPFFPTIGEAPAPPPSRADVEKNFTPKTKQFLWILGLTFTFTISQFSQL